MKRIALLSLVMVSLGGIAAACGAGTPSVTGPEPTATATAQPAADDPLLAYGRSVVDLREQALDLTTRMLNWQSFEKNRSLETFQPLVDDARLLADDVQALDPPPAAAAYQQMLEAFTAGLVDTLQYEREFVRSGDMEQHQLFLNSVKDLMPRRSILFAGLDELLANNGLNPAVLSTPEASGG